jgi:uncharacterized protein YuzE
MKIILDGRYLMPMEALSMITEVKEVGPYNDISYITIGEPTNVVVVADSRIVDEQKGVEIVNASATVELDKVRKLLAASKLVQARRDAVDRILTEKQRVTSEQAVRYVATLMHDFQCRAASSEDVKKFLRLEQSKKVD